jgi:hypothetical protein
VHNREVGLRRPTRENDSRLGNHRANTAGRKTIINRDVVSFDGLMERVGGVFNLVDRYIASFRFAVLVESSLAIMCMSTSLSLDPVLTHKR